MSSSGFEDLNNQKNELLNELNFEDDVKAIMAEFEGGELSDLLADEPDNIEESNNFYETKKSQDLN